LYVAFEDNQRRIQERLRLMTVDKILARGLRFEYACPRLHEGGQQLLDGWIESIKPKMVVIDTIKYITRPTGRGANLYDAEHAAFREVSEIAKRHRIAIVAVHHNRKAIGVDRIDEVSGSAAVTGVADTVLLLNSRGLHGDLYVTGRDVRQREIPLSFDEQTATWRLRDPSDTTAKTDLYRLIIEEITRAGAALSPKQIAERLAMKRESVRTALHRMCAMNLIRRGADKRYAVP
jgi:hypothetical protein